mmetsp:Transcript_16365/g.34166  ORF Transcript_16365/g.34166 Transcript_16365/m.34166 type:complete len:311 (+) Transcript_16365:265-1197(+)
MDAARNLKADLNTLEDDGTRSTASVADGGSGKASIIILQHREGRAHDARTRAPDRVADGHGTTMHVDLGVVEVKQVHVREGHNRKRFINLVEINIARRHASMSEGLGHRERRRGGELNRVLLRIGVASDAGDRRNAELGGLVCRHEHHGSGAVVNRRGVGGGDRALLHERRSEACDLFNLGGVRLLVRRHEGRLSTTPALDLNGDDLVVEHTAGKSVLGASVRLNAVGILVVAAEIILLSAGLGAHAHVLVVVDVPKSVVHDAVNHRRVTQTDTAAGARHVVRDVGHGLHATSDHNVALTERDGLGTHHG